MADVTRAYQRASTSLRWFTAAMNLREGRRLGDINVVSPLTHKRYVATGKCASIHHGMWCFRNAHHRGDHKALDIRPMIKAQYIFWPQTSGDSSNETVDKGDSA